MAPTWRITFFLLALSLKIVHSLHFNLIHKYSVYSPLFPGNLTKYERAKRLYADNIARAQTLRPSLLGLNYSVEHLRPTIKAQPHVYMVEIYIGTPAKRKYYLVMDTASDILWMQCKPCIHCWKQPVPIFHPARESSSFEPIPCNHTLCDLSDPDRKCVKGQCHYTIKYAEGSSSKGLLASETLGFSSDRSQKEFVHKFVFGCANDNRGFSMPKALSGLFGLDMEPLSLASQLTGPIGGRFSYCLPPFTSNRQPPSRLKFGDEAILKGPHVKTIRIIYVPTQPLYYLPLSDVSVAGHRLGFTPKDFALRKDAEGLLRGGVFIDSGSTYTAFRTGGPYERISEAFRAYFKQLKLQPANHSSFEVCYRVPHKGVEGELPGFVLHFIGGVDYVVSPQHVIEEMEKNIICVGIVGVPNFSILGEHYQYNHRISYNVREKLLSFAPADCSRVV
ncbi:aspartic proteinase nepenthesin-1-like [Ananas comosus]|uniref:Aspartic proteinase nepenthesin-1-like n=1 Tax=Ananas comosus TaxID=4615 RepID=A0A6P5GW66_ANACO|nr:aspartic proteinase nepenthesin-1-like [Ananas comosus]